MKDFKSFAESRGARLAAEFDRIPMVCDKIYNFKITATGLYGGGKMALQKSIIAYVVDFNKSAAQIKSFLDKEKKEQNPEGQNPENPPAGGAGGSGSSSSGSKQEPLPKGPPRIVYWTEY